MKNTNWLSQLQIKAPLIGGVMALGIMAYSSWLPAKAWLAHQLIHLSWQQSSANKVAIRPWPWADTSAVAKMELARLDQSLIILQGVDPTSLAFSAGAMHQYAQITENKPMIIAGHRDTHFKFLQDIIMKDIISLTDTHGVNQLYQVEHMEIIDSAESDMQIDEQDPNLILITCYPFDALNAGGSLRYVIRARPLNNETPQIHKASRLNT